MIGASGMSSACTAQFGFNVVDTFNGTFKVYYFPVNEGDVSKYQEILTCIRENGVSQCYDHAILWHSSPI